MLKKLKSKSCFLVTFTARYDIQLDKKVKLMRMILNLTKQDKRLTLDEAGGCGLGGGVCCLTGAAADGGAAPDPGFIVARLAFISASSPAAPPGAMPGKPNLGTTGDFLGLGGASCSSSM